MTDSLSIDFNGLGIGDEDDDGEFNGPPVVRRRGVTFEVAENQPKAIVPPHTNGDGGGGDDQFQNAGQFMDDLDFLENCGGANDGAMEELQRKSLYVKFDPLCKSPLANNAPAVSRRNGPMKLPSDNGLDNTVFEDPTTTTVEQNGRDELLDVDHFSSAHNGLEHINGGGNHMNGLEDVLPSSGRNGFDKSSDTTNGFDHHNTFSQQNQDRSYNNNNNNNSNNSNNNNNINNSNGDMTHSPIANGSRSMNKSFSKTPTGNMSSLPPVALSNGDLVEPLLYSQSDMDEFLRKAREDFEEEKRACEADWQKKFRELESNVKEEVAMRKLTEQDNAEKVDVLRKETSDMKQILSQYELTIVELTENLHLDKKENEKSLEETIRSKEQMTGDLNTAEQSVCDAYKRIEKLKETVAKLVENEVALKKNSQELVAKIEKSEDRYDKLKAHAAEKIDNANAVIAKVRKQQDIDMAGLNAQLKLSQSKVNTLKEKIEQKDVENQQLTQICDDLIKKVSH